MTTGTTGPKQEGETGAGRWIGVLAASLAVLVVLRTTSGALTGLLVIIVLGLLLEGRLNRRSRVVRSRR